MNKWSKDLVKRFEDKWYSGLITIDHIPDNKVAIKIKSPDKSVKDGSVWGWAINQRYQKLFLPDTLEVNGEQISTLDMLPIKITKTYELEDEKTVYNVVSGITEFKITPAKIYTMEEILGLFLDIKHSNHKDYTSYLIVMLTQIILKYNWRIASTGGFGKSGLFKEVCNLLPDNTLMKLKTESKVMKEAHKKTSLVFDEFTDVKESVKRELDSFFKISGDGANKIKNPAHGSSAYGTLDEYDTTFTSYGFFYNTFEDAKEKGLAHQYFDSIYDFPTRQRYFPLLLEGEIRGGQFEIPLKLQQQEFEKNERIYINFIKSMLYYQQNPEELDEKDWVWKQDKLETLNAERLKTNLNKILIGVKACSKSEEEFQERCNNIWNSYKNYLNSLKLDPAHELHRVINKEDLTSY